MGGTVGQDTPEPDSHCPGSTDRISEMSILIGRALESLADRLTIAADDILLIREAAAILNGDDMTTKPIKTHRYVVDPHGRARLVEKPARVSVSKKIAMKKSKKTKPVKRAP